MIELERGLCGTKAETEEATAACVNVLTEGFMLEAGRCETEE